MFVRSPISILSASPRATAPYQMPTPDPICTVPTIVAFGAIHTSSAMS
ncbi:hypothetical protein Pd630_LPD07830 [Rhodococcus opacus PD630]|nr:hypothetical protein Pd630_LPD07830 [Rhodococcus opacus PD630]